MMLKRRLWGTTLPQALDTVPQQNQQIAESHDTVGSGNTSEPGAQGGIIHM